MSHVSRTGLYDNGRLCMHILSFWGHFCDNIGTRISNATSPCFLMWRCQINVTAFFSESTVLICTHLKHIFHILLSISYFAHVDFPPRIEAQCFSILLAHHMVEGIGWSTAIHSGEAWICWQDDGFLLVQSQYSPNKGSGQCQSWGVGGGGWLEVITFLGLVFQK